MCATTAKMATQCCASCFFDAASGCVDKSSDAYCSKRVKKGMCLTTAKMATQCCGSCTAEEEACTDRANAKKCKRLLDNGKCESKKAEKKCQATCSHCR